MEKEKKTTTVQKSQTKLRATDLHKEKKKDCFSIIDPVTECSSP